MRLESTEKPDQYKVWLTDDELDTLRRHAGSQRNDLVLQFGGYVGLRAFEIPQVCPKHVTRTSDGDHYRLRVPEGKDTSGGGGKPRDAYLPAAVERDRRPERTVHFTEQEFDTLACHAGRLRDELLMQFGGRCGLRGSDIVGWERPDGEAGSGGRPCDRRERDGDGERRSVLDIRGKDTRPDADGPNERTTWVPADTWNAVRRHINRAGLGATAPLIHSQTGGSLGPQSARRVVKDVARPAYEATGRETSATS